MLGEERPIISLLPSSHVLLQASARFLQVLGRKRAIHAQVTLEDFFSICKWIKHVKNGDIDVQTIQSPMFPKSSLIATCQESFFDTCHTNCCRKKQTLKNPIALW